MNGQNPVTLTLWFLAFVIGGYDKAIEGWTETIKNKSLNVEFLMILAATAAFITQDFAEGSISNIYLCDFWSFRRICKI
jgi:Zn2+/Cd2+-exporting ATPase